MMTRARASRLLMALAGLALAFACVTAAPRDLAQYRWWSGLGPVLSHDTFPADCSLCHVGDKWHELRPDFEFDHEAETGYPLVGAHQAALCLRCHNDRGPVKTFAAQGCQGCHEDVHQGDLGKNCAECHHQRSWRPDGMFARHNQTRFPLTGAHARVACRRCHPGAEVGNFLPTDTECVTCHTGDLLRTTNHVGLGWVDRCDRCHLPTAWPQAEID